MPNYNVIPNDLRTFNVEQRLKGGEDQYIVRDSYGRQLHSCNDQSEAADMQEYLTDLVTQTVQTALNPNTARSKLADRMPEDWDWGDEDDEMARMQALADQMLDSLPPEIRERTNVVVLREDDQLCKTLSSMFGGSKSEKIESPFASIGLSAVEQALSDALSDFKASRDEK